MDIPGVLAISLKGGACLLGEAASVLRTLWQAEQIFWTKTSPLRASPTSTTSTLGAARSVIHWTALDVPILLICATTGSAWGPLTMQRITRYRVAAPGALIGIAWTYSVVSEASIM